MLPPISIDLNEPGMTPQYRDKLVWRDVVKDGAAVILVIGIHDDIHPPIMNRTQNHDRHDPGERQRGRQRRTRRRRQRDRSGNRRPRHRCPRAADQRDVLAGLLVALVDDNGTVLRNAATDGSGAYSFPAVSVGSYRIRLLSWPAGGAPTTPFDVAVTVSAGDSVTVDLMGIHMAAIEIPTLSHTALALLVLAVSAAAWWRRAGRRRPTMARRGS